MNPLRVTAAFLLSMTMPLFSALEAAEVSIINSEYRIVRAVTDKSYDDVTEEIEFAITERNFRITGKNVIGKAIRKRGHEDFPNVDVIHFCNVENAREVLEHDIEFVSQMPCRMTVHEAGDKVVIQLILVPEAHSNPEVSAFARRMNRTLKDILAFVLEDDAPLLDE